MKEDVYAYILYYAALNSLKVNVLSPIYRANLLCDRTNFSKNDFPRGVRSFPREKHLALLFAREERMEKEKKNCQF